MESVEDKLKTLSIARRAIPEEPTYLLNLCLQPASNTTRSGLLAVSCSDQTIKLHNMESLKLLGEYKGHTGLLCGVSFAHTSPDQLYSGSADGTLRTWDVRCPGSAASQVFKSDPSHHFCSFDVNAPDRVLCAGTEKVGEDDSFLVFWDARVPKADGGGLLGVYSESHSDDVTEVCFHPRNEDMLASGSLDGLVNVFDLSLGPEDQALMATCNGGSSASSVCWAGRDADQLLCLGHDEALHLWDLGQLHTEEPLTVFSSHDARTLTPLADGGSVDYLVGGTWLEESQRLLVVGGENNGDLHLLECDSKGLSLLKSLHGGHSSVVRCFLWDPAGGAMFTGGEDAQLLLWKPGAEELTSGKTDTLKSRSVLKHKARPHKKHAYQRDKKSF